MSLPYFPMFPTDFEADTSHLTLAEDGAYNRLLRLAWMTPGCSLPDDDAWILRRMRCHSDEDCAVVVGVIDEFFTRANGRVSNARLTREFEKSNDAHEKRVSAGSRGGKAKALKTKKTVASNAVAKPKQCSSNQNQNQNHSKRDTNVSPKKPAWPDFILPEVAKGFEQHRIAKKAKLTPRAVTLLSKTLHQIRDAGMDPNAALDLAIDRGWQGLKFEWVEREFSKGTPNERPRTAQERAAANHSDVASAWIAEGRRRDQERGVVSGQADCGDPGEVGMDSRQASDAVVSLFPAGTGYDGFGGSGLGLDEHPRQISAGGHRDGL